MGQSDSLHFLAPGFLKLTTTALRLRADQELEDSLQVQTSRRDSRMSSLQRARTTLPVGTAVLAVSLALRFTLSHLPQMERLPQGREGSDRKGAHRPRRVRKPL